MNRSNFLFFYRFHQPVWCHVARNTSWHYTTTLHRHWRVAVTHPSIHHHHAPAGYSEIPLHVYRFSYHLAYRSINGTIESRVLVILLCTLDYTPWPDWLFTPCCDVLVPPVRRALLFRLFALARFRAAMTSLRPHIDFYMWHSDFVIGFEPWSGKSWEVLHIRQFFQENRGSINVVYAPLDVTERYNHSTLTIHVILACRP